MWTGYVEIGKRPLHPSNSTYIVKLPTRAAVEAAVVEIEQEVSERPDVKVLSVEIVPDGPRL